MQIAQSATSVSWIPSDSVRGLLKVQFSGGVMHYDPPPPLTLTDLEGMRRRARSGSRTSCAPGSTSRTGRSPAAGIRAASSWA
jgi:hypothetical protein